jgi:hypothetical protein
LVAFKPLKDAKARSETYRQGIYVEAGQRILRRSAATWKSRLKKSDDSSGESGSAAERIKTDGSGHYIWL